MVVVGCRRLSDQQHWKCSPGSCEPLTLDMTESCVAPKMSPPPPAPLSVRLWVIKHSIGGGGAAPVSLCGSPLRGYSLPLRCISQWQEASQAMAGVEDWRMKALGAGSTHAAINDMFTTGPGALAASRSTSSQRRIIIFNRPRQPAFRLLRDWSGSAASACKQAGQLTNVYRLDFIKLSSNHLKLGGWFLISFIFNSILFECKPFFNGDLEVFCNSIRLEGSRCNCC